MTKNFPLCKENWLSVDKNADFFAKAKSKFRPQAR